MTTTQDKIYYVLLGMLLAASLVSLAVSIYYLVQYYARKRLDAIQTRHIATLLGTIHPETAKKLAEHAKRSKNARF